MSINIILEFKAKDNRAGDIIALLQKLIPESIRHGGLEEVSIRQNQDDPADIISVQRWESRRAYESYFEWRTDDGYTEQFEEMTSDPLRIRFFNEVPMDTGQSGS